MIPLLRSSARGVRNTLSRLQQLVIIHNRLLSNDGGRRGLSQGMILFDGGEGGVDVEPDRSTRPGRIGPQLAAARLERGLSQSELAARCGLLSQAQISYFELDRRKPTLDQLVCIAGVLDVSLHRLVAGADRPGDGLRDVAIELRNLGLVDLWVEDPIVPGAFRRPEEVVARAVSGREPDPRVVEAIPAILAWNRLDPVLLRAYARTDGARTVRRLAWLADVALAIDRRGGFPGGCRKEQLVRFARKVPAPPPGPDEWDGLGRPMAGVPKSPVWKRWRISYEANLERFERRARDLDELRKDLNGHRKDRGGRGGRFAGSPGEGASDGT